MVKITEKDIIVDFMTNNDCFIQGRYMDESALRIMVHSTGCQATPATMWHDRWDKPKFYTAVHAFLDDKDICQLLPWTMRGWHAGGSANNNHISFEICEPRGTNRLMNKEYFNLVYPRAVGFVVYLCQKYNIPSWYIISHAEGHDRGWACNHGDVGHWFPLHGKSMDIFREDVRRILGERKPVITHYKTTKSICLWSEELTWTSRSCPKDSEVKVLEEGKHTEKYLHCEDEKGRRGFVHKGYILPTQYKYIVDEYTKVDELAMLREQLSELRIKRNAINNLLNRQEAS